MRLSPLWSVKDLKGEKKFKQPSLSWSRLPLGAGDNYAFKQTTLCNYIPSLWEQSGFMFRSASVEYCAKFRSLVEASIKPFIFMIQLEKAHLKNLWQRSVRARHHIVIFIYCSGSYSVFGLSDNSTTEDTKLFWFTVYPCLMMCFV